jgi:hypothetical protein
MLAGPHPRSLSLGDFRASLGPQALLISRPVLLQLQPSATSGNLLACSG